MNNKIEFNSVDTFLSHGVDLDNRTIYLGSWDDGSGEAGVDYQLSAQVIKGLHILGNINQLLPITLIINNFGGEDDHCRAIMAAIKHCPAPVWGVVYGRAESAAAWILQVCDHRSMDEWANLMVHMGEGTKDEHGSRMDNIFTDILHKRILEKNPGYKRTKLIQQLHKDWFIYPAEALELGLVDEILTGGK